MLCIGLFGTCGSSIWRTRFIKKYEELGIRFFNPQLPPGEWKEELATVEAEHLSKDDIILFPVTAETYGSGSLAETGFSILQVSKNIENRSLIVFIENRLQQQLQIKNPEAYNESMRARALVIAHLKKINLPNVFIVDSLEKMLELSIKLYEVKKLQSEIFEYKSNFQKII